MHMVRIQSRHTDKQGRERQYESRLLRRAYHDGERIPNETLANLPRPPDHIVDAVEAALKGEVPVPVGQRCPVAAARPSRRRLRDGLQARHAKAAVACTSVFKPLSFGATMRHPGRALRSAAVGARLLASVLPS
jgi:hypothetical protein